MTDLADFLLARIAEDEADALDFRDGGEPGWWTYERMRAECDAKRRIVEAEPERWVLQPDAPGHTIDMGTPDGMVRVYGKLLTEAEYRDRYMELAPPSQTLLYLAMPYADHPEFHEEWRQ